METCLGRLASLGFGSNARMVSKRPIKRSCTRPDRQSLRGVPLALPSHAHKPACRGSLMSVEWCISSDGSCMLHLGIWALRHRQAKQAAFCRGYSNKSHITLVRNHPLVFHATLSSCRLCSCRMLAKRSGGGCRAAALAERRWRTRRSQAGRRYLLVRVWNIFHPFPSQ